MDCSLDISDFIHFKSHLVLMSATHLKRDSSKYIFGRVSSDSPYSNISADNDAKTQVCSPVSFNDC